MKFENDLIPGKLIKRYKRFLADIELENGDTVTAHCTNSSPMKSCIEEGAPVMLSPVNDPKRKTKFTWEMIKINKKWVGINTANPNKLAIENIKLGKIKELKGYTQVQPEYKYRDSRFDVYLENLYEKCFVEVKNVTYKEDKYALFPDAVTTRGKKHLSDLIKARKEGYRAVMLYIIQRSDVDIFAPAKEIDPEYTKELKKAHKAGVEILPYQVKVSPTEIKLGKKLEFKL